MGTYWGSRYLAVTTKENSRVEQVDFMPIGVNSTSDTVALAVPEHLEGFQDFTSVAEAVKAVREWRLRITESELIENVVAKELEQHELDLLRLNSDTESKQKIAQRKALIGRYNERIKALKAFRRGKIAVG